jgi:hypothetical protein
MLLFFKVGDGSGYLQNPRISPGAQSEFINGQLQQLLAGLVDLAEFLDVPVAHLGIAVNLHSAESAKLNLSSPVDPPLDLRRRFPGITARQVPVLDGRDFDAREWDVDAFGALFRRLKSSGGINWPSYL